MGALYRVQQFLRTALPAGAPPDPGELAAVLSPEQRKLFAAMAVVDQRHCLRVAQALRDAGHSEPALLQAALLHDCGKSLAHISVWERVAFVLLQRLAPWVVGRIAAPTPGRRSSGLSVLAHHAALGAHLAEQAGCSPAAVALLRGEGDPALQAALARADDTQ